MAKIVKYQNNFTGGVLSPGVYCRTDLQKYASGCKRIINGIVLSHGGITKRPGTEYIDSVNGTGLLFPFTYSVEQAYALLFYAYSSSVVRMRVYANGGIVCYPSTSDPVEIVTPFLPNELSGIKFTQSADVMFLVHPSHPPMELIRRDNHVWEFKEISFYPSIEPPDSLTAQAVGFTDETETYVETEMVYKVSAVNGDQEESVPTSGATVTGLSTWPVGARVYLRWNKVDGADHYEVYKNARGYYSYVGSADGDTHTETKDGSTYTYQFLDDNIEGDSSIGPKENRDPFNPPATPTISSVTGTVYAGQFRVAAVNSGSAESVASTPVTTGGSTVTWNAVDGAEAYILYFRINSSYQWRYVTSSGTTASLSSSTCGVLGNPLDAINSYPGAVGIYQQRLVFGRSDAEPHTVWLSETGAFDSMAVSNPLRDDSAITATVDSKQMNEIRHFVCLRDILMLTSGAEFQMSAGSNSDAVTPTSISFRIQSYWGSSDVPPIIVGDSLLFCENSGRVVRDMKYQLSEDGYSGNDVSILAEHLLMTPIVDWSYQQDPFSTVWICLESGKLLTFTYMHDQEVWAWAEHESSGGEFISTVCIREGEKDNVYFLVKRDGTYYVEMLKTRRYGDDIEDAWYSDCGLSISGSTAFSTITGLSHLNGKDVVALADGSVVRRTVTGGTITLDAPAKKVTVGLPYTTLVETLDPEIKTEEGTTVGLKKNVSSVNLFVRETRGLSSGPDEDHMSEAKFPVPTVYGNPPELYSGLVHLTVPGQHRDEASMVFVQSDPVPFTILSAAFTISVG